MIVVNAKDIEMAIAPTLTRVSRFGLVNAFLVGEEDGLTLVDTTIAGGAGAILRAAGRLGQPIVRIALTHAHGDHIGQLDALAAALPEAEVLISGRDARLLAKDMTPDPDEPADAKPRGGYPGAATRPTRTLTPGELVGSLEVVAAPGHTPGHVAFLDRRDGTLIAGDAYSTLGGVSTTARANWRFPLVAMATWHRPTALRTARALRALDPVRLAAGHGPVIDNPGRAMDAAITRAQRS
jgi:glyoxylase-like metal-dependent hydrolase (beta-lactamase superfamily II)